MTDENFSSSPGKVEKIAGTLLKGLDKDNDAKLSFSEFSSSVKQNTILHELLCPKFTVPNL